MYRLRSTRSVPDLQRHPLVLIACAGVVLGATTHCNDITRDDPQPDAVQAGACGEPATLISAVQGSTGVSLMGGRAVVIEGVVVGDYQETRATRPARPELGGFYVQEEDADGDDDAATSEGIFVFDPDKTLELAEGDLVRVAGTVSEHAANTRLAHVSVLLRCDTGKNVTPAALDLPVPSAFATRDEFYERFEGMHVRFSDTLTVSGHSDLERFGQVLLTADGRLRQYGQEGVLPLGQEGFEAHQKAAARRAVLLDDFNRQEKTDPVFHPQPGGFAVDHFIRTGATVSGLEGVLNYSFGEWTVQPRNSAPVAFANPQRPAAPDSTGHVVAGAFNVLNYFNGDGRGGGFPTARGAHSPAELQRQTDKLVAAITALNADVLGLMELENDGDAPQDALPSLIVAINAVRGARTYDYIRAGRSGGRDDIKVSLIFKPGVVTPLGAPRVLDNTAFTDPFGHGRQLNRPALAQTFRVTAPGHPDRGSALTVVALHLKSKGSSCGAGDDSTYQGNCNGTRTRGVTALLDWLADNPTGTRGLPGAAGADFVILGDINSYYQEDPLQVLYDAGYANVLLRADHSVVWSGSSGTLDHILVSPGLSGAAIDSGIWHINADESRLLDYNDAIRDPGETAGEVKPASRPLFAPDPFRSSDHDPVFIGLDLPQ